MEFVLLWVVCGVLGAAMLSRYDKAGAGCLLGILLGPIGVIIAWMMRDEEKAEKTDPNKTSEPKQSSSESADDSPDRYKRPRRKCPHCAEVILFEANVCKHCRRDVPEGDDSDRVQPCPYCGVPIGLEVEECPECLVHEPFE